MRLAILRVPYEEIKLEAAKLGLEWAKLTGLVVTTFADDGSAVIAVHPGASDSEMLFDHLVHEGLAVTGTEEFALT